MAELSKLYEAFVPGYREGFQMGDGLPLMTPELLAELRAELVRDPNGALERAHRAIDPNMSFDDLERFVDHLRRVFEDPDAAIANAQARGNAPVPATFRFDGMETGDFFKFNTDDSQFEDGDWTGYGLNVGVALIKRFVLGKPDFRWHDDHASRFHYTLKQNANIALFSDFGTGKPHSYYIAKFIAQQQPDLAIHLGDVYYSGTAAEVDKFFTAPLAPVVAEHELWNIPGNHDYYAGGSSFFEGIDRRGERGQRQEGSYFVLDSTAFRIIGIDGEYHSGTRYDLPRLRTWLAEQVAAAKTGNKQVILLSSDEPYGHDARAAEDMLDDVTANLDPNHIDLWFWGNTHYCALYKPSDKLRAKFYGSCIGHGGYPYKRLQTTPSPDDIATHVWAETEARYPVWTEARQDLGNNGFVMMKLDDASHSLTLEYRDWTNAVRATVTMAPENRKLKISSLTALPRPPCR